MDYYKIELNLQIKQMVTIFTDFSKILYNRLIMGVWNYEYKLQAVLYKLIGDIWWFNAYVKNTLVLINGNLPK